MLRLGTKYQIDHLRESAILRLQEVFPTTLETFRNSYTDCNITASPPNGTLCLNASIEITAKDSIAVINLARSFNLPHLLPAAFYICAQLQPTTLVNGVKDADGTLWKLSQSDLQRCLEGQENLRVAAFYQCRPILNSTPSAACLSRSSCLHLLQSCKANLLKTKYITRTNGLDGPQWIEMLSLCQNCHDEFLASHNAQRNTVWKALPSSRFFNLHIKWPPVNPVAAAT